jgi:UDP-glucose 4-epimerase
LKHTVLVTGGCGYIGSHAVLALRDAGFPVVVIDNLTTGFRSALPKGVPLEQGDVGDASHVAAVLQKHCIGSVMHFAGSIVVPESVANPLKYYRNNTANTRTLLECAVDANCKHFVFSSTAAIYGTPEIVPAHEDGPKLPINPYGQSKLMSEQMLGDVAAAHALNYCAFRYFNVAGADPEGRTGQSTAGATHLLKVALEAALGKRASVAIYGTDYETPDGTGVRDYIHVSDLAAAHVLALDHLIANPQESHTMNVGYGTGFSVNEVLDAVDRVAGTKITRVAQGRRAGDPGKLTADNHRILATLPWKPRFADLDTIVAHALAWERKLTSQRV